MSGFNESNAQGTKFEESSVKDFQKKGFPDARIDHEKKKFDKWDIWVRDGITVECKDDKLSRYRFPYNICIETGQYLNEEIPIPSGINITEATHWLHSDGIGFEGTTIYLATTHAIKYYIDSYLDYHSEVKRISHEVAKSEYSGENAARILNDFKLKSQTKYGDLFNHIISVNKETKPELKKHHWVEQEENEPGKYMDLFIIKKIVFETLCLEFGQQNKMTYKDLL